MPTIPCLCNRSANKGASFLSDLVLENNVCLLETLPYLSTRQRKSLFPNDIIYVRHLPHTLFLTLSPIGQITIVPPRTVATHTTLVVSAIPHQTTSGSRPMGPQVCTSPLLPPQRENSGVGTRIRTTTTTGLVTTITRLLTPITTTMILVTMVTTMKCL